jgi:hypothetical protein
MYLPAILRFVSSRPEVNSWELWELAVGTEVVQATEFPSATVLELWRLP